MRRTASIALLLVLALCGCGSGGSGSGGGHSSAPGTAAGATTAATGAAGTSGAQTADDGNPVDGAQFCAFLGKLEPRLKGDGSAAGAEADFAVELANWIGEHPEQKPRTAADLDDASRQSCPKVRTAAVADLGASSFQDSLG
ncbi:hypothetical protein GA0115240_16064 [Streptomyces sp. DvalAA-14]|uniref:hypothetical protein n=1 Tax=unclassified Streptomyces TaxID=2593676 RepID=UPI00081BB28D|nr:MULTISPECIES: hypothetical protein [unclassified Streptomyces]MYS24088.1 hypothetical protein [Streptomyces sp. SID4948]SCE42509.1 hypothetical protein GA0115240_16064 [Streptomyces sp. DvalAA-14]